VQGRGREPATATLILGGEKERGLRSVWGRGRGVRCRFALILGGGGAAIGAGEREPAAAALILEGEGEGPAIGAGEREQQAMIMVGSRRASSRAPGLPWGRGTTIYLFDEVTES